MEKEKKGSEKKVMVVMDENENSYHALMWVLDNLKESVTKSTLVIFAAQPLTNYTNVFAAPLGFARMHFPVSATPALIESIQEHNKRVSLGLLEKAKSICASRGVNVETLTEAGDAKETICNAVQKYKINLLVMGGQANRTFMRPFQGSLSNYCLKNAKCPVLVVKKPE
uniref:UspA domain-containing protein n=1 Tax=Fagus sylvatica TaxID=28930 RepID=A0A2N9FPF2_FAGSY